MDWQHVGSELLDEAVGRSSRTDPVLRRTGGPAGNARLTAWTGLILLALFLAELVTLLDVNGLINWHVAIGVLLVPPALLKTATTGWRLLRYYGRGRHYVSAGPPIMPLRLLGPLVVLSTLGLLGSGLVLIAIGQQRGRDDIVDVVGQRFSWVNIHQGLFIVFAVVTGLHVLARFWPAALLVSGRRKESPGRPGRVPGAAARVGILALVLACAGVTTALVLPLDAGWRHEDFGHFDHFDGPPPRSAHR